MKSEHVRAVGTQSLRQARNLDEFLLGSAACAGLSDRGDFRPRRGATGIRGLHAHAAAVDCAPAGRRYRRRVDRSHRGQRFEAENAESFKVGCVNTSLRFFKDGRIDRSSLKKAQVAAAAELEEAVSVFSHGQWDEAYRIERNDRRGVGHLANSRLDRRHDHSAGTADVAICATRCWRNQAHSAGRHEARSAGSAGRRRRGAYRLCSIRSRSRRCGQRAGRCASACCTTYSAGASARICATRA